MEGDSVRSRLWSLILKELPFPFRQIGLEIAQILRWLDVTAAKILTGFKDSPAWYFVTTAGAITFLLTGLLFLPFFARHDPTLGELTADSRSLVATRASMEAAGDWSAQDRWRLAHMFVDHRPPRRLITARIDGRILEDTMVVRSRSARDRYQDRRGDSLARHPSLDPDVRLDLSTPKSAAETRRLVYDQLVRQPGSEYRQVRATANYQRRDSRLLVQAEWAFAADCTSSYEFSHRPSSRRTIPVPEPDWNEPRPVPSIRNDRHPDLAFQMELLREFLPSVGEFPPRSRVVVASAHSEFPHHADRRRRPSHHDFLVDRWLKTTSDTDRPPLPEAYVTRVHHHEQEVNPSSAGEADEDDVHFPSFAEIALRLELYAPASVMAGRPQESSVLLRNEGPTPVSLIRVRESLPDLQTVTDAQPAARIHLEELERDVRNLVPGHDRRLSVTWLPDSEGSRVHRAAVTMHAAVMAITEVTAPVPAKAEQAPVREIPEAVPERHAAVTCELKHVDRVVVDDVVELEIFVRNTGNTSLRDVRIVAQIPAELKHRQGQEVEFEVGNLPVRGSQRAVMRLLAVAPGRADCRLQVMADEAPESQARAVIDVVDKPALPQPTRPTRALPAKPALPTRTLPRATSKTAPVPMPGTCCCPNQPVAAIFEPWFIP